MILLPDIYLFHHLILSTSSCFAFKKIKVNIGLQGQTCFYKDCSEKHPETETDSATEALLMDFSFPAVGSLILQIVQFKLMAGQKKLLFSGSHLLQKVFQHCLKLRIFFYYLNQLKLNMCLKMVQNVFLMYFLGIESE